MICTFYSFKGGVGRSMALANVAEILYRRNLKVRVVDFDLEAPGLERYFDTPQAATSVDAILSHRGVVDMLEAYRHLADLFRGTASPEPRGQGPAAEAQITAEPLSNFIVPIYANPKGRGRLSLISAGRRDAGEFQEYARRVLGFNWDEFFLTFKGERFFEWFRGEVVKDVDVVLIDSRTGVTEMSGVCTYHLADVVVSFVAPNNQNLDGVVRMAASLANPEMIARARKGRELLQVFVPSRVANDDETKVEEFRRKFEAQLGPFFPAALHFSTRTFIDLKVPYVPTFAYDERVAGREDLKATEADLLRAFEALAEQLAKLAPVAGDYYGAYISRGEQKARAAEQWLSGLDDAGRRQARNLLTRLVRIGGRGERPVAAQLQLSRPDAEWLGAVTEGASTHELITVVTRTDGVELTLAAEDLIEKWPALKEWIETDRQFLLWRRRIDEALADWNIDRSPGNLLSGNLLLESRAFLAARREDLSPSERDFIRVSIEQSEAQPASFGTAAKNIVICSDMTSQTTFNKRQANAFKLLEAIDVHGHRADASLRRQATFFDDGHGTETLRVIRLLAGMTGYGFSRSVKQLYRELCRVYEPGDRIFLFGCGRGAFAVRALAELIAECGILDATRFHTEDDFRAEVRRAYASYRRGYRSWLGRLVGGTRESAGEFRQRHSRPSDGPAIRLLGVWDTVDPVRLPFGLANFCNTLVWRYRFDAAPLPPIVERAVQALALDEDRAAFAPVVWDEGDPRTGSRVEQVWFAGAHSTIGGYPQQGLSALTLDWMMKHAESAGLRFVAQARELPRAQLSAADRVGNPRSGLGVFYRWKPRDVEAIAARNGIHAPLVHVTVVERIVQGTEDYAPGNIPPHSDIVATEDYPQVRLGEVAGAIAGAHGPEPTPLVRRQEAWVRIGLVSYFAFILAALGPLLRVTMLTVQYPPLGAETLAQRLYYIVDPIVFGRTLWFDSIALALLVSGLVLGFVLSAWSDQRVRRFYSAFWHRHRPALRDALRRMPDRPPSEYPEYEDRRPFRL